MRPGQHNRNVEQTWAMRAQVSLNQSQSGGISNFWCGARGLIENLSTRKTCTIIVTEGKCMRKQLF